MHKAAVRDWMTPDPVTITVETSLIHAYEVMQERTIRRLPVVDSAGALRGIITRSDIQSLVPFGHSAEERADALFALAGQTVEDHMTSWPVTVAPDEPISHAAQQMQTHKISGVPVVEDGRPVGIITESDIFRFVASRWAAEEE